jgi:CRP-like cAMP-binding protein
MDARSDTIRFLKTLPGFTAVNATTIGKIAARCQPMSRQPGQSLFIEGDPCRDLYILAAGRVKCYRANVHGRGGGQGCRNSTRLP